MSAEPASTTESRSRASRSVLGRVKLSLLVLVLLALTILVFQNWQPMEVVVFFWEFELSRAIVLLAMLLVGVILGLTLWVWRGARSRPAGNRDSPADNRVEAQAKRST